MLKQQNPEENTAQSSLNKCSYQLFWETIAQNQKVTQSTKIFLKVVKMKGAIGLSKTSLFHKLFNLKIKMLEDIHYKLYYFSQSLV